MCLIKAKSLLIGSPGYEEENNINWKAIWHYTNYLIEENNMQLKILQKEQDFFISLKITYTFYFICWNSDY